MASSKTERFVRLLESTIRRVVREELDYVISKGTVLESQRKTLVNKVPEKAIKSNPVMRSTAKQKSDKKLTYTKDPVLNEILHNTVSDIEPDPVVYEDTNPVNHPTISDDNASTRQWRIRNNGEIPTTIDGKPVDINNENVKLVLEATTRDYSAFLKRVDEKDKNRKV